MELTMERASLALRTPYNLPSTFDLSLDSDSSDSVVSELKGLERRKEGYGHHSDRESTASGGLPHSSTATLSPSAGKHGGHTQTTLLVHANATGSLDSSAAHAVRQQTAAPAIAPVERTGARVGAHGQQTMPGSSSPAAAIAPTAGASRHVQQSPASLRSASPDGYSDDGFEAEGSQPPSSPSSSIRTTATTTRAAARSQGTRGGTTVASGSGRGKQNGSRPSSGRSVSPGRSQQQQSRTASRLGHHHLVTTAATEAKRAATTAPARPHSAAPRKQQQQAARPVNPFPGEVRTQAALEARVSKQMCRDPADWTVREVCDWAEVIGLGQYRRKLVHHAVGGDLLLRLTSEQLRTEVGIGPLGHREGLLAAINDLDQYWQQQQQQRAQQRAQGQAGGQLEAAGEYSDDWGSPSGSRPASPPPRLADCSLQRAYAQRAKLLRDLEKAESREAHRRVAAEQALRVTQQASEEVRKLQSSIWEIDREIGWDDAAIQQQQHCQAMDHHGALAWQPAGRRRAAVPRGRPGSPDGRPGSGSSGGGGRSGSGRCVSPMSCVSRRIMEAQAAEEGGSASFLERLGKDIANRQSKAAAAAKRAGRQYLGSVDEQAAEQERGARDVQFIREIVEARNSQLGEALGSGEEERSAEAVDDAADSLQEQWGLSNEVVTAVHRLRSVNKKATRLAGALRSTQFMQRLEQDLSTREGRLKALQDKYFKLEAGNSAEQQEQADLAAAQHHFALLGWAAADLQVAPGDDSAGCDALLKGLLQRAAAVQAAQQRGKGDVDWEAAEWRLDGLSQLQEQRNLALQAALDAQAAAAEAAEAQQAAGKRPPFTQGASMQKELPQPSDHLGETVDLLAACRPSEVALLEGLRGYRKLVMCWRAVRAQQFVAFTRHDLELRKAKAAALERSLYPDTTKRLGKEEFEAFFDRLMADTARRSQHRDELAEEARAEALAKLKSTAPPPLNHHRAASPAPGAQPAGSSG